MRPSESTHNNDLDSDIPEEADLVIMSDDAGQVYAPPAHIAARFYRNALTRRKSSAASSRRNSLSSTHSHASSRSYHRGASCQSNHVAQHLRRASIIETRKARLADRAAHAEQVRLRAALAKAAPRASASTSEERALAAHVAREKYLAQVAASCAEEVKRAKKIAEEMKERKREEEKRVRMEMEERLAEAEKRRTEYKKYGRRMRTTSGVGAAGPKSLAVVEEDTDVEAEISTLDRETAAQLLQRAWRTRRRKLIVDAYSALNLTIDRVRDTSFDEMNSTSRVLRLFGLQEADSTQAATTTRTFLSVYLILGHPAEVLSKNGHQEQDLITKAKDLMICFEWTLSRLASWNRYQPSEEQHETLSQAHATFTTAFAAWRAQDSSALVETMVTTFVELDGIWQTVKDDTRGEVASDYKEGIRNNQVILLSKITKLAGHSQAQFLIKKAINESRRRRRVRRRPAAEVRPRAAEEVADVSSSQSAVADVQTVAQFAANQETAPQYGAAHSSDFARLFSRMPDNRTLTHELAIDKEYRIGASPLRDAVNEELCKRMQEGFAQGQGTLWTVAMAENIREKLLRTLRPTTSMHTLVSETLDSDHVYTQCTAGVFSYDKFFSFMASVLPKLCAPFRDAEVNALAEELQNSGSADVEAMISILSRLLHVIDILSLDHSNFLLMNIAPVLIKESAGYEQRQFAQDLESGEITLQKTKRWWRNASVNMLTEADRRDPENVRLPEDRPTAHKIYARGLVDLAICPSTLQDDEVPETLQLDTTRLSGIRADVLRITTIGAILLNLKNMLRRDVRTKWKAEATRLWDLLSKDGYEPESAPKVLSILESAHNMPPATRTQLASHVLRFLSQAAAGRLADPVLKVLFQRLKSHVFVRVGATSSADRVRAASTASEGLAGHGFAEFGERVGRIVEVLGRVGEVDWAAHGRWYELVAREVREAGDAEA
ncbi:hypothetical protein LTR66_014318 [Elasticomyces elasticus]|nr:hypothetical protein LTR66_014318 [Elasticomyces elasticus]